MAEKVLANGWHPGLGFPLKPMVLLDGLLADKPEYYRAVVLRVDAKKDAVQLQWVHVPGRRMFWLPCSSDRIWRHSYKQEHWTKLQKEGAWRPRPSAHEYIYVPVAVRPAPAPPTATQRSKISGSSGSGGKQGKRKAGGDADDNIEQQQIVLTRDSIQPEQERKCKCSKVFSYGIFLLQPQHSQVGAFKQLCESCRSRQSWKEKLARCREILAPFMASTQKRHKREDNKVLCTDGRNATGLGADSAAAAIAKCRDTLQQRSAIMQPCEQLKQQQQQQQHTVKAASNTGDCIAEGSKVGMLNVHEQQLNQQDGAPCPEMQMVA